MRDRNRFLRFGALVLAALWHCASWASETQTFVYDELGRLVSASNTGTVNNGQKHSICYDAAGNRTQYKSDSAGSGITCTGTPPPLLSITNASVTEGGTLVFTVTRASNVTTAVGASYATTGGTATSGSDFTAVSGMVNFAANQTSTTISVATIDDTAVESAESMTVNLSAPTGGATLGTSTVTGTINDNDVANLAIGNASATESGTLAFTVTRSGVTTNAASASYASAGGTATSGSDFTATSGTVSFAANETTKTINVVTINDTAPEATETMSVTLFGPSTSTAITVATGAGTILDNDSDWSSTLTAGTYTICPFSCITLKGYNSTLMGILSNTTYGSSTITGIYSSGSAVILAGTGTMAPPNSGWVSISVPGVGTLNRTAATYSTSGTSATWSWTNASAVISGTVTIQ